MYHYQSCNVWYMFVIDTKKVRSDLFKKYKLTSWYAVFRNKRLFGKLLKTWPTQGLPFNEVPAMKMDCFGSCVWIICSSFLYVNKQQPAYGACIPSNESTSCRPGNFEIRLYMSIFSMLLSGSEFFSLRWKRKCPGSNLYLECRFGIWIIKHEIIFLLLLIEAIWIALLLRLTNLQLLLK